MIKAYYENSKGEVLWLIGLIPHGKRLTADMKRK